MTEAIDIVQSLAIPLKRGEQYLIVVNQYCVTSKVYKTLAATLERELGVKAVVVAVLDDPCQALRVVYIEKPESPR